MREPGDPVFRMKTMWLMHGHPRPPGWYFWDETWGNEHGPFETEQLSRKKLAEYVEHLEGKLGEVNNG